MKESLYAFLFGIIGTVLFHVGKSMQKQGILFLSFMKCKYIDHDRTATLGKDGFKTGLFYCLGIVLNNTIALWIMLANLYAPASYFSSMFGIGLIALMIYSHFVLDEEITRRMWIGVILVMIGTFVLGFERIHRVRPSMANIDITSVMIVIMAYLAGAIAFMIVAYRSCNLVRIGLSTGFFTGGLASMDPVLKGIGQHYGGMTGLIPSVPLGWAFFALSFIFSTVSFVIAQLGFARNAPVAIQVSTSTSVYICFPTIIIGLSLPGYTITHITVFAMACVVGGILLILGLKNQLIGGENHAEQNI